MRGADAGAARGQGEADPLGFPRRGATPQGAGRCGRAGACESRRRGGQSARECGAQSHSRAGELLFLGPTLATDRRGEARDHRKVARVDEAAGARRRSQGNMVSEGRLPAPGSVRRAGEVGVGIKLALVGSLGKRKRASGIGAVRGIVRGRSRRPRECPPTDEA